MEHKEFIECDTCKTKPGSPTLCMGCYSNRNLISQQAREIKDFEVKLVLIEDLLKIFSSK